MGTATFAIEIGPVGLKAVEVNGVDVSAHVSGCSLVSEEGQPTLLRLLERPGSEGKLVGEARLTVDTVNADVDQLRAFVNGLSGIAIDELMQKLMDEGDEDADDDETYGEVVVRVLRGLVE